MPAPAPSVLSQPVKDALDAVTLARSNLADDTDAQKKLLEAVQKDVDDDKLDADSANGLLAAYGAKEFVKAKAAKDAAKPAEPAAKPAEPAAKPAEPAAKPAEPAAKPAEPAAKPAEPTTHNRR